MLADYFARRLCREILEDFPGFAPSAIAAMEAHRWPGNVRELRNFAERITHRALAVSLTEPIRFDAAALDPFASPYRPGAPEQESEATNPAPPPAAQIGDFEALTLSYERQLIDTALSEFSGHQGKAADALGLTYHQLRGLLRKHGYGKRPGRAA